jgi:hypothetical protein
MHHIHRSVVHGAHRQLSCRGDLAAPERADATILRTMAEALVQNQDAWLDNLG